MINLLGILVALIVQEVSASQPEYVGWGSPVAALAGVALAFAVSWAVGSHVVNRLRHLAALDGLTRSQTDRESVALWRQVLEDRHRLLRAAPVLRVGVDGAVLAIFAASCFWFGWSAYVRQELGVPRHLDILPGILPYLLALAASWVGQYRMEHAQRGDSWTLRLFLEFNARANLMTVAPIILVNALYWALLEFVPGARELKRSFYFAEIVIIIPLIVLLSMFVPVVIRWILPVRRLPDGPLRTRLETLAKKHQTPMRQIYVWKTGSPYFATAFVVGLVGPLRYVFLTDALLKMLNDDQIEAVFAHEMGHVHHRHLWLLLTFLISLMFVFTGIGLAAETFGANSMLSYLVGVAPLLYGYLVFGFVSRRFERQADQFAVKATGPAAIVDVFRLLGTPSTHGMDRSGWRHFSLNRRIREIQLLEAHPEVRPMFAAELRRGILVAAAVTLLGIGLLVEPVREDVITGLATYSFLKFDAARVEKADPRKIEELRAQTVDRLRAMADLSEDYDSLALTIIGATEVLAGRTTDAFEQVIARTEARRDAPDTTAEERKRWVRELRGIRNYEAAARNARESGRSFEEEHERVRLLGDHVR